MELLIIVIICAGAMGLIMLIDKKVNEKIEEKELFLKREKVKKENNEYLEELYSFADFLVDKNIVKSEDKMKFMQEIAFRDYRKKEKTKLKNKEKMKKLSI